MTHHEEQILDASLEEVLGGHSPPDLSARILRALEQGLAWGEGVAETPASVEAVADSPAYAATIAPPIGPVPDDDDRPLRWPKQRKRSRWQWYTAVAGVAAAMALAVWLREYGDGTLATNVERTPGPSTARTSPLLDFAANRPLPAFDRPAATPIRPARPKPKSSPDAEVIAFVNDTLRQSWREHGVEPAPPTTDEQWCRRAYVRLIGREPNAAELERFLRSPGANKRPQLVEELLASADYAQHWGRFWTDALLGTVRHNDELASREELQHYLTAAIRADKSYDRVAVELLSATGSTRSGDADYNPATYFLLGCADGRGAEATDRIARVFLGRQMVCAQCHDHPSYPQVAFWELNSFLRQMRVQRDPATQAVRLVDEDFHGETGVAKDAEIFYQAAGDGLRIAYPALDGARLPHSGMVSDVNRRQELARLVVAAPDFPRAAVNRVWAGLLGVGFTQPVDEMGPHNRPSQPAVLDRLADEFTARDFNLDALVRWIVLSEPFGLSVRRAAESWQDAPEAGGPALFARYYQIDERPRDVYKALVTAVHARPAGFETTPVSLVVRRSPSLPGVREFRRAEVAVVPPPAGDDWLGRLGAAAHMRPEQKIEHVFRSVLARKPTEREMLAAKLVLADRLDDTTGLREVRRTLLACGAPTTPKPRSK